MAGGFPVFHGLGGMAVSYGVHVTPTSPDPFPHPGRAPLFPATDSDWLAEVLKVTQKRERAAQEAAKKAGLEHGELAPCSSGSEGACADGTAPCDESAPSLDVCAT